MDAVARSRRALLGALALACVLTALAACGSNKAGRAAGASDRVDVAPTRATAVDAGADAGAPLTGPLASYRASMTKLTTTHPVSLGHAGGRWEIDAYCNESAARALASNAQADEGAACAVEHFEHAATKARGPVMFMQKQAQGYASAHGDWRYVVVGASGAVVSDGPVDACADCHDEAPGDRLFLIRP